jgi:TetR/AcrR family transcriptional repressor of bet genes
MTTPIPLRRKASREVRREQLIDATISTIAKRGFAQTTLTDVANAAGVSHGLVIFYFESKEKLFSETLRYMSETYRRAWTSALADSPPDPASRLNAIIEVNFSEVACTPDWLSAWISFWSESQSRPLYVELCNDDDVAYLRTVEATCADLIREGDYTLDPIRAARMVRLTIEAVWVDLMFPIETYSRDEAKATVHYCVATLFPRHFDASGLIRR